MMVSLTYVKELVYQALSLTELTKTRQQNAPVAFAFAVIVGVVTMLVVETFAALKANVAVNDMIRVEIRTGESIAQRSA